MSEIEVPKKFRREWSAIEGNLKSFNNENCRVKARSRLMDMVLYSENNDAPSESRKKVKAAVGTIVDLCIEKLVVAETPQVEFRPLDIEFVKNSAAIKAAWSKIFSAIKNRAMTGTHGVEFADATWLAFVELHKEHKVQFSEENYDKLEKVCRQFGKDLSFDLIEAVFSDPAPALVQFEKREKEEERVDKYIINVTNRDLEIEDCSRAELEEECLNRTGLSLDEAWEERKRIMNEI